MLALLLLLLKKFRQRFLLELIPLVMYLLKLTLLKLTPMGVTLLQLNPMGVILWKLTPIGANMEHLDISVLLVVSQEVMPDVYVLSAAVFNRIICHADCTLIVT
jgi:hypothetical protein